MKLCLPKFSERRQPAFSAAFEGVLTLEARWRGTSGLRNATNSSSRVQCSPLKFAGYGFGPWTLPGRVDEVSLYNRALSTAEIRAIYMAGSAGKCFTPVISSQPQGQVGYWGTTVTFSVQAR